MGGKVTALPCAIVKYYFNYLEVLMKAIGFDLGKTLIDYKDIPLGWQSQYQNALCEIANKCELKMNSKLLYDAEEVLYKYNTRKNPRIEEFSARIIIGEILDRWNLSHEEHFETAESEFFMFFRKGFVVFHDTIEILKYIKLKGVKTAILTDAPYGMSKKFLDMDIEPIKDYIDFVVSSVEIGVRKPHRLGYELVSNKLELGFDDIVFVGDEEKDVLGANSVGMYSVLISRDDANNSYGQNKTIRSLVELKELF